METNNVLVGSYAPDFELPGIDEQVYHLGRYLENWQAVGVVFLGNNCSYVTSYIDRLKQIQAEFEPKGFSLIGINSNDTGGTLEESFEAMKNFAKEKNLTFPYLRDPTQDVAKSFKVQVTPTVFLVNSKAIVCYQGSIDDNAESAENVQNQYLRNSITALLQGQEIAPNLTEPIGSYIKWRK